MCHTVPYIISYVEPQPDWLSRGGEVTARSSPIPPNPRELLKVAGYPQRYFLCSLVVKLFRFAQLLLIIYCVACVKL